MIYAESASQTIAIDPDHCIKNYETLPCPLSSCTIEEGGRCAHTSASSSSAASLDEQLARRINPTTREDFTTLEIELACWRKRCGETQ